MLPFFVFLHQHRRCGFVCISHRRRPPNHPLPSHHRHGQPPSLPMASLLAISTIRSTPLPLFHWRPPLLSLLPLLSIIANRCCRGRICGAVSKESDLPPPCFPPMPPVIAHFFYLCTLHSRKHSHIDEHDRNNDRDTSEEGGDEEDDEKNTPDPEVHGAPMYQEFIAGQERKEPPREVTLGNINAGLQKDPAAPNYDAVAVIFIVIALLCSCDAFPPLSSSSASPSALAP